MRSIKSYDNQRPDPFGPSVDVVICLAHASFSTPKSGPEGELVDLARSVTGIDLICAGHSHSRAVASIACRAPQQSWTTTLIEAGSYANFVGRADLHFERGRSIPERTTTEIVAIDDSIPGKPETLAKIDTLIADIEAKYLTRFPRLNNGRLFAPLAKAAFAWGKFNSMNLVADAMRSAAASDVALCTPGGDSARVHRDSEGNINVYETFSAMPHGDGRDALHGGALYRFHLLAAELQGILELGTCNSSQGDGDRFLVPSGLKIVYTTADLRSGKGRGRLLKMALVDTAEQSQTMIYDITDPLNIPYGGWKAKPGSTGKAGDPQQLLSVSTSQLTLIGLKAVTTADPRAGIDLWPRDQAGRQVRWSGIGDADLFVVRRAGGEMKAWFAVAQYVDAFGGSVPLRYDDVYMDGRSHNPVGPPWRRVWDLAAHPQ
jgi:2',3'-cyclic-nucleotide 2'-phosphodiesterase (5'-nucleotidase family)